MLLVFVLFFFGGVGGGVVCFSLRTACFHESVLCICLCQDVLA